MLSTPLNKILPQHLDPRKFAQQGITLMGEIELRGLPRIAELALPGTSEIRVELAFEVNDQKQRVLRGQIEATLPVMCQRCMDVCDQHLKGELNLGIVWDEEKAKQLPKSLDAWIAPEGPSDIYEVIEEEMLLCLPMASYHDHQCVDIAHYSSGDDATEETAVAAADQQTNPFQVLEQLKGTPK